MFVMLSVIGCEDSMEDCVNDRMSNELSGDVSNRIHHFLCNHWELKFLNNEDTKTCSSEVAPTILIDFQCGQ